MCQVTLDVQLVFLNVSAHSLCSACVSECVRSLLMFTIVLQNVSDHSQCSVCVSECVRLLSVQFVFQNVSDHSRCSVCVSECVRLLSVFSLCFKMCRITPDVLNVSDHS